MAGLPVSTINYLCPPDLGQAKQFLQTLAPEAPNILFVAIKGAKTKITRQEVSDLVLTSLADWNSKGFSIYVTVNETNNNVGLSRKNDEVTKFRCVFIDDDGKNPAKPYPIEPSIVIETSPGKKQVYFLLSESMRKEDWDGVQQTLVNEYGGDSNARDASRILRVPGYYNVKPEYKNAPVCKIISINRIAYTRDQMVAAFPPSQVISSTGKVQGEALDIKSTMEQFITGTNYHQAAISLAGYFYNKGVVQPHELTSMLQSLMDIQGDASDPRFQQRRNVDIPASVNWILKERGKEAGPEILDIFKYEDSHGTKYTRLPVPGGGMFTLIHWVRSIMRYPNETIAIIVAEHLVSVFGGGHYHIMNNTTTRKRIMLAPLGSGKNTITRALSIIVRALLNPGELTGNLPLCGTADKFIGSDSFSFSVQHKQLEEHRVRSFLVNEAGEAGKSEAGDINNLRAYQLQALSTKADEAFMPKKYSEQNKKGATEQMQTIYNCVWVYMHESTIDSYASLLQNTKAFVNGDLSRSDIFFVDPDIKEKSINPGGVPPHILKFFGVLANDLHCRPGERGDKDEKVWEEVDIQEIVADLDQVEDNIIKARNKAYAKDDEITTALLGRKFERIITSVLISALADAAQGDAMVRPVAKKHHLEYALKRAEAIDLSLKFHASQGGALSGNPFEKAEKQFISKFEELIKHRRKALRTMKYAINNQNVNTKQWILNYTVFTRQLQKGAYQNLCETVYRGDSKRARVAFIDHLEGMEILTPMMEKNKDGDMKKIPNRWWLNSAIFPYSDK